MNIDGIQPPVAPAAIEPTASVAATPAAPQATAPSDVVEISIVAKLAAKIHDLPEVRADLVERVKSDIAAGKYETPDKVDIAVERLMDELFG